VLKFVPLRIPSTASGPAIAPNGVRAVGLSLLSVGVEFGFHATIAPVHVDR